MIVTAVFVTTLSALALAVPTRRATVFTKSIGTVGNTGLCVDSSGNDVVDGTPVVLADCGPEFGSPWAYDDATGAFSLTGSNQCLDVKDGVNGDGTKLQTWQCTGGPNQKFAILSSQNTSSIQWVGSNKCLDVTDGVFSSGTPLQIWDCIGNENQLFFFMDLQPPVKFVATAHPTMCINVAGGSTADGTSLEIATCNEIPTPAQQSFTHVAGGFHVFNNSAIDLTNGDQTNGNKLQIWTFFARNINQVWFYDAESKAIRLSANAAKCIDVTDGAFTDGTMR